MRMRLACLTVAVAALVSGCGLGASVYSEPYDPTEGANGETNGILLRNAFMIGAPGGRPLRQGEDVPLYFTVVSERATGDRLVEVGSPGLFDGTRVRGDASVIPRQRRVGGTPEPQALLTGLTRPLRSGEHVPVTFRFERAGRIEVNVPVLPPSDWRATFRPWQEG